MFNYFRILGAILYGILGAYISTLGINTIDIIIICFFVAVIDILSFLSGYKNN